MRPTTLAAACLALVLSTALATTARSAVPAPDQLRQWNPSESWPGGEQYDPRLEQTVTFWNAGLPLAEVFRNTKEQTGVSIGFRPAGDVNARICVNLYLNADQPPTLREVMAQLSWAVDCTFSYEDDGGEIRYSLLSTSMGEGDVIGALERRAQEEQEAEAKETAVPEEEILRVRDELREALTLSREEAIRRYRDHDECVLWDVLDPARRALTELYVSWPIVLNKGSSAPAVCQRYSSLPPEQQQAALEAARYGIEEWVKRYSARGQAPQIEGDPIAWLASADPQVGLALLSSYGQASVSGVVQVMGKSGVWGPGIHLGRLAVGGMLDSLDYVELRRLLGDIRTPEDEERVRQEYSQRMSGAVGEPPSSDAARERHEQIPPEMERLLNSLQVLPDLKGMYALWQVQEAVAKVSGLNIVSDCFWQPYTRDLRLLYLAPGADKEAPPTALMVLKAATVRLYPWHPSEMSNMTDPFSTGWEWRGAGQFLTFRSLDRDIWRAAFLPTEVVQTMDAWVEPSLPPPGVKKAPTLTPDWRAFGRLASDLSVPQLRWGGLLAYGDPTGYREACRQSLRELMLAQVNGAMGRLESLCLISSLSEAQWQELCATGLAVGRGLPLSTVQEAFRERPGWTFGGVIADNVQLFDRGTASFAVGDVLRVRGGQTEKTEWEEPQPTLELQVMRRGQRIGRFAWPTSLTLRPRPVDSIPLPPTKAGPHPSAPPADNSPD
jgi:hypothetical protein